MVDKSQIPVTLNYCILNYFPFVILEEPCLRPHIKTKSSRIKEDSAQNEIIIFFAVRFHCHLYNFRKVAEET